MSERKAMLEPGSSDLSLSRQCKLLSISRSSAYYQPKGESQETLALMRRIDELFMAYPFYGSRQMQAALALEGIAAGRHRVRRLMGLMGLQAIYQKPNTSKPHPEHRVYSYKLRKLSITRPNHVWCTDITYIPMQRGFLYLVIRSTLGFAWKLWMKRLRFTALRKSSTQIRAASSQAWLLPAD